jgi:hypothetical protein
MRAVLATLALWAKAAKIKRTQLLSFIVFEIAVRAKGAESAVIVWACWPLGFGLEMEVKTVVAVGTYLIASVCRAFGHASQVVFVQVVAFLNSLAKAAQPMLADYTRHMLANEKFRYVAYIPAIGR